MLSVQRCTKVSTTHPGHCPLLSGSKDPLGRRLLVWASQSEQWLCTPRGSDGFLLLTSFCIPCVSPPRQWLSACLHVVVLASSLSLCVSCFSCFFLVPNLLLRLPGALFLSLSWPLCEIGVNASPGFFVPPRPSLHRDVAFYASLVVELNLSISLSTVGGSSSCRLDASCLLCPRAQHVPSMWSRVPA